MQQLIIWVFYAGFISLYHANYIVYHVKDGPNQLQ